MATFLDVTDYAVDLEDGELLYINVDLIITGRTGVFNNNFTSLPTHTSVLRITVGDESVYLHPIIDALQAIKDSVA